MNKYSIAIANMKNLERHHEEHTPAYNTIHTDLTVSP